MCLSVIVVGICLYPQGCNEFEMISCATSNSDLPYPQIYDFCSNRFSNQSSGISRSELRCIKRVENFQGFRVLGPQFQTFTHDLCNFCAELAIRDLIRLSKNDPVVV